MCNFDKGLMKSPAALRCANRYASLILGLSSLIIPVSVATASVDVESSYFSYTSTGPAGSGTNVPDNLALSTNGSTAFAIDEYGYGGVHTIAHLNDGIYGNSNSWIGQSSREINFGGSYGSVTTGFAGIELSTESSITSFAFGRDKTGVLSDRVSGTYYIQMTTASTVNKDTEDSLWTTLGSVTISENDAARHLYTFNSPVAVTGLRIIVVSVVNSQLVTDTASCIDEIEIYGTAVPEPSSCALLTCGLAGLLGVVWRRRRSSRRK